MYAACLTPQDDSTIVRRAMCGVPRVDALILAAGRASGGSEWVLATLHDLRRELFLDPELQVVACVAPQELEEVVRKTADLLIESRCPTTTIGVPRLANADHLVAQYSKTPATRSPAELLATLPNDAQIESIEVQLGAAAMVEAVDSGAKIVLVSDVAPGCLVTAAVFEALQLPPRDWNRLATVVTIARLMEQPMPPAPLWLEIDSHGQPYCLVPDTLTVESFLRRLGQEAEALRAQPDAAAVTIDLSQVEVAPTTPRRYALTGVVGTPPSSRTPVRIGYHLPGSTLLRHSESTVERSGTEWSIEVKSAKDWRR